MESANLSSVLRGRFPADSVPLNKHSQLARRKYTKISVRFIFRNNFSELASRADRKTALCIQDEHFTHVALGSLGTAFI